MFLRGRKIIALAVVATLSFGTVPVFAATVSSSTRLAGNNRIETSIKIAEEFYENNSSFINRAILAPASDKNLVDSLTVAPLAYKLKAPILLNDSKDSINKSTLDELKNRKVREVYIPTGVGVISEEVEKELLLNGIITKRLGGNNRYDTALNILNEYKILGGDVKNVFLVSGNAIPDALSVAPMASEKSMPIVLAENKDKVASQMTEIVDNADKVYAIGGQTILSDNLVNKTKAERISGKDRYETNSEVINKFYPNELGGVYLANGNNNHLVDSLTASVLAADNKGPIVLTNNELNDTTSSSINGKVTKNTKIVALGGEKFVPNKVIESVKVVEKPFLDSDAVKEAKEGLNLGDLSNVTSDLTLPTSDENGVFITWKSSNPLIISNDGKVNRPYLKDEVVTLTATLTKGISSDTKVFTATVKKDEQLAKDMADVQSAKNALDLGDLSNVTSDLILPTSGDNGVSISWLSSNPAIIAVNGRVNRPYLKDDTVKLTATLVKGKALDIKEFYATVKKETINQEDTVVVNNVAEYKAAIKNSIENFNSKLIVKVKNYNDTDYSLDKIQEVVIDYPDIDYGYRGSEATISGYPGNPEKTMTINLKYALDKPTMQMQKAAVKLKTQEILASIITPEMSMAEKELAIHDYIVENAEYDVENYENGVYVPEDHNAYGVLVKGIGVCESYAKAMYELLTTVGIECKYVTGNLEGNVGHAWNMVKLDDGQWYNVDATWDDPTYTNAASKLVKVSHKYFNLNDTEFNKDHVRGAYEQNYPAANGTLYSADNMKVVETDLEGNEFIRVYNREELDNVIKESLQNGDKVLNLNISELGMTVQQVSDEIIKVAQANKLHFDSYSVRYLQNDYASYTFTW